MMYKATLNVGPGVDLSKLPAHLAGCLREIHAGSVEVNQNRVSFLTSEYGGSHGRHILIAFGFGDLTVNSDTRQLTYRLSFRQLLVEVTFGVGFMVGFSYLVWRTVEILVAAPIGWIWLVGINLLVGLPSFHMFVKGAIKTAPRTNQ